MARAKVEKKTDEKLLENVYELITFLKDTNTNYVTKEGHAFIDGMYMADRYPEFVSRDLYIDMQTDLELRNRHILLVENELKEVKAELEALKSKKRFKFF
jgi:hypothetical protein